MFEGDPSDDLRDGGAGAPHGRQQERLAQHVCEVDVHIHLGFPRIDALLSSHGWEVPRLMRAREVGVALGPSERGGIFEREADRVPCVGKRERSRWDCFGRAALRFREIGRAHV